MSELFQNFQRLQRLRLSQIEALVGFKKSKIYELIREGNFPAPLKIGRSSRWDAGCIEDYLRSTDS
jgi:predicted DNA-binding transcriptional regulator AlpA